MKSELANISGWAGGQSFGTTGTDALVFAGGASSPACGRQAVGEGAALDLARARLVRHFQCLRRGLSMFFLS